MIAKHVSNWPVWVSYALLLLVSVAIIFFFRDAPFYWDNVTQLSVPANWYYSTHFQFFYLPDDIATGHPTFTGMYFAFLWSFFGRSLLVSHLAMFPFVFGLLTQLYQFLKNIDIKRETQVIIILTFLIFDATLLSQLSLITFDVIQLFFFFFCLNQLIRKNDLLFSIFYVFLILVSLRSTMVAAGLFLFNLLYDRFIERKDFNIKDYYKYLSGFISILLFLFFFKLNKGWIIHNTVSKAWESSGHWASFSELMKNVGVFCWRLIDFGRIGIYLAFLLVILKIIVKRSFEDKTLKILFWIIVTQIIVFFPVLVTSNNSIGHRYLLTVIIPTIILVVYWLCNYVKNSSAILILLFVVLLSGHFWIYPVKVSQGWDSTTLHWNYLKVNRQMNHYVDSCQLDKRKIASFFPNKASGFLLYLDGDDRNRYNCELNNCQYVIFSNTFNLDDSIIDELNDHNKWREIKQFRQLNVYIALYHRVE